MDKYSKYGNITDMSMTLTLTRNKFKIEKSRVNVGQKWKSRGLCAHRDDIHARP